MIWIGGAWVALVVVVLLLAAAVALMKFVAGNAEWEGVVMLPTASVFGAVVASPGSLLLAVGLLLERRAKRRAACLE
jgi:hypothetical protein